MKRYMMQLLVSFMLALPASAAAPALPAIAQSQHKAMHAIVMWNGIKESDQRDARGCTAYSIAPHVLLTAEHCNVDKGRLYIDPIFRAGKWISEDENSVRVSRKYFDHMDHMLLVIPDVTFKHTVVYDPDTYKAPLQGEAAYFWGNPSMMHDHYRRGYMTGTVNDIVEEGIDATGPVFLFDMRVVGGDSGSSVFADDGRIVCVVTYGVDGGNLMGCYPLAFTKEQVLESQDKGEVTYSKDTEPPLNITSPEPTPPSSKEPDQPENHGGWFGRGM